MRDLKAENARLNAMNKELRGEVDRLLRSNLNLSRRVEQSSLRVLALTEQINARNAPAAPATTPPPRFSATGGRS